MCCPYGFAVVNVSPYGYVFAKTVRAITFLLIPLCEVFRRQRLKCVALRPLLVVRAWQCNPLEGVVLRAGSACCKEQNHHQGKEGNGDVWTYSVVCCRSVRVWKEEILLFEVSNFLSKGYAVMMS